jgi:hypothetical protein
MVIFLVSGILLVPSHPFLTLFRCLELYKLTPKRPQLDVGLSAEIWSEVLLDKLVI